MTTDSTISCTYFDPAQWIDLLKNHNNDTPSFSEIESSKKIFFSTLDQERYHSFAILLLNNLGTELQKINERIKNEIIKSSLCGRCALWANENVSLAIVITIFSLGILGIIWYLGYTTPQVRNEQSFSQLANEVNITLKKHLADQKNQQEQFDSLCDKELEVPSETHLDEKDIEQFIEMCTATGYDNEFLRKKCHQPKLTTQYKIIGVIASYFIDKKKEMALLPPSSARFKWLQHYTNEKLVKSAQQLSTTIPFTYGLQEFSILKTIYQEISSLKVVNL